jgi:hypothetical protein
MEPPHYSGSNQELLMYFVDQPSSTVLPTGGPTGTCNADEFKCDTTDQCFTIKVLYKQSLILSGNSSYILLRPRPMRSMYGYHS